MKQVDFGRGKKVNFLPSISFYSEMTKSIHLLNHSPDKMTFHEKSKEKVGLVMCLNQTLRHLQRGNTAQSPFWPSLHAVYTAHFSSRGTDTVCWDLQIYSGQRWFKPTWPLNPGLKITHARNNTMVLSKIKIVFCAYTWYRIPIS